MFLAAVQQSAGRLEPQLPSAQVCPSSLGLGLGLAHLHRSCSRMKVVVAAGGEWGEASEKVGEIAGASVSLKSEAFWFPCVEKGEKMLD